MIALACEWYLEANKPNEVDMIMPEYFFEEDGTRSPLSFFDKVTNKEFDEIIDIYEAEQTYKCGGLKCKFETINKILRDYRDDI